MEEFLIIIIQFFCEFIADVLLGWGSPSWGASARSRYEPEPKTVWPIGLFWFIGAAFLGWLSLFIFPNALISVPALRVINLILAPLASASLAQYIAKKRAEENPYIVPRERYWQAFWFTFGFTAVRLAYATHA